MSNEDIEKIKKNLEKIEARLSALEGSYQSKNAPAEKEISIKEFILSKKPKDDVQRTLAIGYYLEKYQHLTSFNIRDLVDGFRVAKDKVPPNMSDKVQMNAKKGHMTEAKEKKDKLMAYYLTNTGEQFVENDFKK